MHIAIDARIINSSTGRYIERLLTYLEQLDSPHEFSVLVRAKDKDYWKPTNPQFKIVVADYHQYTFGEQLGFYFFLRKLNADLVHFCMPQQPLLYTHPAVTTIHDLSLLKITENEGMSPLVLKFKQTVFGGLLRIVIKRAQHIIAISEYTKKDILDFQKVSDDRITITYEAADLVSETEEPVERYVNTQFIIVVGRAETYKNQRGAIEAHHILQETHPELHLVIIGKRDDTSKALEQEFGDKGYTNVEFFGFASDAQLAWFYSHCAAYVFPSFYEGFGLPGLEAMRHGAPVISSNATCLPEVYGDGALYFDPANPSEMASQIARVLDSADTRTSLVAKGTKQVAKYSWQRMAEQTLTIYDAALVFPKE